MIETGLARQLILDHSKMLEPVLLPLQEAAGLMLAEPVFAPYNIPAYPQSSMDGYAFAFADAGAPLRIIGEQAAGDGKKFTLSKGEAVRIFTGAAVPEGADTVIMQEKAVVENGCLVFDPVIVRKGDHVRPIGSEIALQEAALQKRALAEREIGFLAAIGVHQVRVIPSPRISLIVTGNELLQPGEPLEYGKVFEASSFALRAALERMGFKNIELVFVKDDADLMTQTLAQMLDRSDLILMTGGVSVGDHDHTAEAAARAGVEKVFHKVKQRPGKPLYFGVKGRKLFFGLPGNPSSVLTCFYEYVLAGLSALTGKDLGLQTAKATLGAEFRKPKGLTHFLKGVHKRGTVVISGGQESYKLHSFATANCLVMIPEEVEYLPAGAEVELHLLP